MKRQEHNKCIEENKLIETGDVDTALASELFCLAEHREQFWKEINKEQPYPSLYIEELV